MLDDLSSMALFAYVVQLRSFTAAAQKAKLAKSAVSKRISALEDKLGVRLLQRTTRRLSLTEVGLRFYEHCATLLNAANAATETTSLSQSPRGPLRLNAPITFSQMYLTRATTAFLQKYPEIEVHLSTDDRFVDLVEGGFDIVLRVARLRDSSLVSRKIASARLLVVGSPTYLSKRGEPTTPEELLQHNCLHYSLVPLSGEWRFWQENKGVSIPVRGNFTATDGTVLREAALSGLGLVVVPSFMIAKEIAEGKLKVLLGEFRRSEVGVYALTADRKHPALRVKLFLDFLSSYFSEKNWELNLLR